MRPSLEGLIHTPQLSNCTKLQGENDYTLIFCLLLLLHTKVPLATSSNMDTPPRDSNDLSSVIMCQCYIQLQQPPVLNHDQCRRCWNKNVLFYAFWDANVFHGDEFS